MECQQFSVLMSVYAKDNPQWLREAVESVINQTVKPSQIVLVADGPVGPDIEKIIFDYEQNSVLEFKVLRLTQNSGLGIALQKGLEICRYPLVARMDSDDISMPNRFELQLNIFKDNKDLSMVGGYIQEIDCCSKMKVAVRKVPLDFNKIKKFIKTRSPFNHVTVMFKKEDVLKSGSYQSFYCLEDYYLWIRMLSNNLKMINIRQILVNVRIDKQMFSRRGGYKYFLNNKVLAEEMLKLKIINYPFYIFNISVRFVTQVLMPNQLRRFFYKKILR